MDRAQKDGGDVSSELERIHNGWRSYLPRRWSWMVHPDPDNPQMAVMGWAATKWGARREIARVCRHPERTWIA